MHDEPELYRAARMYYVQDLTMARIAERLGVSRSTVSRMLAQAREQGIVRISLTSPQQARGRLVESFAQSFGVRASVVTPPRGATVERRREAVSREAAKILEEAVEPGHTVAVAWGATMSQIAEHVTAHPLPGVRIVQLNGAVSAHGPGLRWRPTLYGRLAEVFGAELYPFPTPAFFDHERTRQVLWQESSIRAILQLRAQADLAVFGVGAFRGAVPSAVYAEGYLPVEELNRLREQNVAGDVCTVFLREDGTFQDIDLNRRVSGPPPPELARIPRRLCVACGEHKVPAILGALRAGAVTDLVVDDLTAELVLRRHATTTR